MALLSGGPAWLPNEARHRSPSGRISAPVLLTVRKLAMRLPRRERPEGENGTWPFAGEVIQDERHSVFTLAYSEPGSIQKALYPALVSRSVGAPELGSVRTWLCSRLLV